MGKLSLISKAIKGAEEGAAKAKAAERTWAETQKRRGQLKGLQEYFEHNNKGAPAPKPSPLARAKQVDEPVDRRVAQPRERRTQTSKPKLDLRRRAEDAESLASGYRAYADAMDADPREMQYFVDANKLKALNDNYGFSVGDRLIELQNQYLRDELGALDPNVKAIMARGPGDEVFLAGNDDAIMREAIDRANHKLITEGVHMDLPDGSRRTISGVSSLKYGAGKTLDEAEADLMGRKTLGLDDRGDASEAIDVVETPRYGMLERAAGGPVHRGIGGVLKKVGKAIVGNTKALSEMPKGVIKNPRRLLTGVDPAATKIWNATGLTHDKPLVGVFGGPTEEQLDKHHVNKLGRTSFKIADQIAANYATAGLGSALGKMGAGAASKALASTAVDAGSSALADKSGSADPGAATSGPKMDPTQMTGGLDLAGLRRAAMDTEMPSELERLRAGRSERAPVDINRGSLRAINGYLTMYEGGLVPMADKYPYAEEGEYADGDEWLGEDDEFDYYACGGQVEGYLFGGLKKAVKKVAKGVGKAVKGVAKVGKVVAPIIGKIPGVGTVAAGVIGGLSGLIADGNLKGALSGALNGVSGGLTGWSKLATSLGASALDMTKQKDRAKVAQMAQAQEASAAQPNPEQPKLDLAALRQQAMDDTAALPTELSKVQADPTKRVAPSIPGAASPGLLQQIQAQQAARQPMVA